MINQLNVYTIAYTIVSINVSTIDPVRTSVYPHVALYIALHEALHEAL